MLPPPFPGADRQLLAFDIGTLQHLCVWLENATQRYCTSVRATEVAAAVPGQQCSRPTPMKFARPEVADCLTERCEWSSEFDALEQIANVEVFNTSQGDRSTGVSGGNAADSAPTAG